MPENPFRLLNRWRVAVLGAVRQRHWTDSPLEGIQRKRYRSYADYESHQGLKLDALNPRWVERYDRRFSAALRERLEVTEEIRSGMTVLCLAARVGSEVKAFLEVGCFAVGIDLNPGRRNRYVVYGDFHQIQYPDHVVDVVYTNSLDHALEFDRVITEIRRVLKPGGLVLLEAGKGTAEGGRGGTYEAARWSHVDELLALFTSAGFQILRRYDITVPWKGEHVAMRAVIRTRADPVGLRG